MFSVTEDHLIKTAVALLNFSLTATVILGWQSSGSLSRARSSHLLVAVHLQEAFIRILLHVSCKLFLMFCSVIQSVILLVLTCKCIVTWNVSFNYQAFNTTCSSFTAVHPQITFKKNVVKWDFNFEYWFPTFYNKTIMNYLCNCFNIMYLNVWKLWICPKLLVLLNQQSNILILGDY